MSAENNCRISQVCRPLFFFFSPTGFEGQFFRSVDSDASVRNSILHCLLFCLPPKGPALHASWRRPPNDPPRSDSPHADAPEHHPHGPSAAARLSADRCAHHGLLLLADRHHRHHQSSAGPCSSILLVLGVRERRLNCEEVLTPRKSFHSPFYYLCQQGLSFVCLSAC